MTTQIVAIEGFDDVEYDIGLVGGEQCGEMRDGGADLNDTDFPAME